MTRLSTLPVLLTLVMTSGCVNLMAARAIQTFADGVATGDMEMLKASSSPKFDRKALRLSEAIDDLGVLNLPKGKVTVANVTDVSPTEKRVFVEVGETKKRVQYKLTRANSSSNDWRIDDIYLKQRKPGDDKEITKSVTEMMDLLLTAREFLDRWKNGGREEVLAVTTPELALLLDEISPVHLQQLTSHVVGGEHRGSHRPEARIEENRAILVLPRASGKLLVEFTQVKGRWLVNDVAVESRDQEDQVRSTRRMAQILRTASRFLNAYDSVDMAQLENVASSTFYRNSLAVADLTSVPIPSIRLLTSPYTVRVHDGQAHLIFESPGGTYMLTLDEREPESYREKVGSYEVAEVTIYDEDKTQVKRLSALFTAQSVLEIFSQALVARDLSRLKQSSTADFSNRVWNIVDAELLNSLVMEEIEPAAPRVVATVFQGAVTEITVTQGSRALTYVLRDSNGRMVVDDVLLPVVDRPNSLKQNLRAAIPVYGMARAFFNNDVAAAAGNSSASLSEAVWMPLGGIPQLGVDAVRHLTMPVSSLSMTEDRADMLLGNEQLGTRLTLTRVNDRFVVDNATFVTGPMPSQRVELKRAGQLNLAAGPRPDETPPSGAIYATPASSPIQE